MARNETRSLLKIIYPPATCCFQRAAYKPFLSRRSTAEPCSISFPFSNTKMVSE